MRLATLLFAVLMSLAAVSVHGQTPQPTGCPRGDGGAVCLGAGGAPLDVALVSDGVTFVRLTRAGVITFPNGSTISGTTFPFVFGSQVAGDTMYASSATAWSRLAVGGTAGMFIRSTGTLPGWSTLVLPNAAVAGDILVATATNTVGSVIGAATGQVLVSGGVGAIPAYSATPTVTSVTGRHIANGAVTSVANVGANSCGTDAATIAGTDNAGAVTVGATSGTQCRITFSAAAGTRRHCAVSNESTAALVRAAYVTSTTSDLLGTFVAGDVLTYVCFAR